MYTTRKKILVLAQSGLLAALSVVMLMIIPSVPLFPAAPFLRYDMADVPIILGGIMLGPIPGLAILVVASAIQAFAIVGDGILGFLMHVIASGVLLVIPSIMYRRRRTRGSLAAGLVLGTLGMTAMMTLWNLIITPIFLGAPLEAVLELLVPAIIPFNLLKAGINSAITMVVFIALEPLQTRFLNLGSAKHSRPGTNTAR